MDTVRTLYLPLCTHGVVVPMANVAEITANDVALGRTAPEDECAPEWFLGSVPWRGRMLPLCAFETMVGSAYASPGHRGRIAVLHGLTCRSALPFIGFVIQASPNVVIASSTSVNWIGGHSGEDGSQYTAGWVDAGGYEGWIPALEAIECELMEALS